MESKQSLPIRSTKASLISFFDEQSSNEKSKLGSCEFWKTKKEVCVHAK